MVRAQRASTSAEGRAIFHCTKYKGLTKDREVKRQNPLKSTKAERVKRSETNRQAEPGRDPHTQRQGGGPDNAIRQGSIDVTQTSRAHDTSHDKHHLTLALPVDTTDKVRQDRKSKTDTPIVRGRMFPSSKHQAQDQISSSAATHQATKCYEMRNIFLLRLVDFLFTTK